MVTGMPPHFAVLVMVIGLALINILWAAQARTAELGLKWNAGPRDGNPPPPGELAGRLKRAQDNLFETLPLFAAAVIMAVVMGKAGPISAMGALAYAAARIVYLPLYVYGVPYLRSVVWVISLVGLIVVIAALFV